MSEDNHLQIIAADDGEARHILSWQQSKYQHIQSLSQGILTAQITILAVAATILAATYQLIPSIPLDSSQYVSSASSSILPIGGSAALLIVLVNWILFYVLVFMSIIFLLLSLYKLFDVATSQRLPPRLPHNSVLLQSDISEKFESEGWSMEVRRAIMDNNRIIKDSYIDYVSGSLRIPASLSVIFVAIYLYYICTEIRVITILSMDLTLLISAPLVNMVSEKFVQHESSNDTQNSLAEEMILLGEGSRWELVELTMPEKILTYLVSLISLIALLAAIVSMIF
ncbi:hypothetical protein [Halorientalis halophila]|uniref:hypothetical protein n=1 Tax=Halorientalis halophila TaxID=3108499 RepID=UPI003009B2F7